MVYNSKKGKLQPMDHRDTSLQFNTYIIDDPLAMGHSHCNIHQHPCIMLGGYWYIIIVTIPLSYSLAS